MAKEQVVLTIKTYVDGALIKETAKLVEDEWGFWRYVLPAFGGFFAYWLIVAWG